MSGLSKDKEEEALRLYREPAVGSSNSNSYGEENIQNLVGLYQSLDESGKNQMKEMVTDFSKSGDLATSYISVAVLHALGMKDSVSEAYEWAKTQDEAISYSRHFDIGISLADYFFSIPPTEVS
ncbi:MAG: hypothetical protein ACQ9MH_00210 [Nitrospinales bacterium]